MDLFSIQSRIDGLWAIWIVPSTLCVSHLHGLCLIAGVVKEGIDTLPLLSTGFLDIFLFGALKPRAGHSPYVPIGFQWQSYTT
jgi:hypothetical protein